MRNTLFVLLRKLIKAEWHMHMYVNKATIGSDNGLVPNRHQAII